VYSNPVHGWKSHTSQFLHSSAALHLLAWRFWTGYKITPPTATIYAASVKPLPSSAVPIDRQRPITTLPAIITNQEMNKIQQSLHFVAFSGFAWLGRKVLAVVASGSRYVPGEFCCSGRLVVEVSSACWMLKWDRWIAQPGTTRSKADVVAVSPLSPLCGARRSFSRISILWWSKGHW